MDASNLKTPTLWIVGTPLDETAAPSPDAMAILAAADVVVGETRGITCKWLKQAGRDPNRGVFFMDPPRDAELEAASEELERLAKAGGRAALFSDTGMPIAFDPGKAILDICRRLKFTIRSVPAATSWGTACALSGFEAPYHVMGFPPRDTDERRLFLSRLKNVPGTLALMDTPYRFRLLLKGTAEALGKNREAFLGWQIATASERLLWGSLGSLEKQCEALSLDKGEFVLVIAPQ